NYLNNKRKIIETSAMLIFDTNLEENIISFLLELVKDKKMIKITDAVSVEKSLKLKGKLTELDYLRANLDEAEVILDIVNIVKMEDSESAQKMDLEARLERLKREYSRNKELPEMIISAGQNGVYYLSQSEGETELRHFEAVKVSSNEIVETTGAGDALTAGFAAGIMNEMSINEAIKLGIKASALTVKSELTCSPDLSKLV
ncbi:pfkB family carbohydrate kinase, partial [Halanaerobium congolense]